jgi:Leucine-rich repeat (LRR) protein
MMVPFPINPVCVKMRCCFLFAALLLFSVAVAEETDPATVRALRLDKTETNNADLEKIVDEYPNLVELTLSETQITDAGLASLTKLTKLRKIRISKTAVTDEAAQVLAKIPSLEDIDVSQNNFGDKGLKALQPLAKLKRLNLYTTKITDKGLAVLKDFKSRKTLIWLNIDKCSLTDEVIPFLFPLENLEWLHLGRTRLTDAGLAGLTKIKTLKEVSVTNTNVTLEGVKKFHSVLPECKINENVEAEKVEEGQHAAP